MLASDVLFKGKLEVTCCHTDTGHMHVVLKRISVYSHYSVMLRIAMLTLILILEVVSPPNPPPNHHHHHHHHLASHFVSILLRNPVCYFSQSSSPLQTVGQYPVRKCVQIFLSRRHHFQPESCFGIYLQISQRLVVIGKKVYLNVSWIYKCLYII